MTDSALIAAGCYSTSGTGRGPGIRLLSLDAGDAAPQVEEIAQIDLPDPSFVLWSADGSLLYAVLETDPTRLVAIAVGPDGSEPRVVGDLELEGAGGCHLAFGPDASSILVAQYGSGSVATVQLDDEGIPQRLVEEEDHRGLLEGGDPRAAHPHQVVVLPGSDTIAVPDLGLDVVALYRRGIEGGLDLVGEILVGRGSGPRHLAADHESEQLHIACELSGEVATAVRARETADGPVRVTPRSTIHTWSVRSRIPASSRGTAGAVSHIELTADESHLLVANRGPQTLSLLSMAAMRPHLVAEVEVGAHPRHFTQLGDLVLVAAQEGDRIDVLRRGDDRLEVAAEPIPSPSVSCLAVRP